VAMSRWSSSTRVPAPTFRFVICSVARVATLVASRGYRVRQQDTLLEVALVGALPGFRLVKPGLLNKTPWEMAPW
jgi:hypothetical protein